MKQYTALQSMMVQIADDGSEDTLKYIETISDAFTRFRKRNLFYKAIMKMKAK